MLGLLPALCTRAPGGTFARSAPPEPTCTTLLRAGTCNQTISQQLASAGNPLLTPLPLTDVLELVTAPPFHRDNSTIAALASYISYGNFDLCVSEPSSRYCVLRPFGHGPGPTLGLCLPASCTADIYLQQVACLAQAVHNISELPIFPQQDAGLLDALSLGLDYLSGNATSACAGESESPGPGALIVSVVLALLLLTTIAATLRATLCVSSFAMSPPVTAIRAFDMIANTRSLFKTRPTDALSFLNGVRALSFGYIVLGHSFVAATKHAANAVPA